MTTNDVIELIVSSKLNENTIQFQVERTGVVERTGAVVKCSPGSSSRFDPQPGQCLLWP